MHGTIHSVALSEIPILPLIQQTTEDELIKIWFSFSEPLHFSIDQSTNSNSKITAEEIIFLVATLI